MHENRQEKHLFVNSILSLPRQHQQFADLRPSLVPQTALKVQILKDAKSIIPTPTEDKQYPVSTQMSFNPIRSALRVFTETIHLTLVSAALLVLNSENLKCLISQDGL